MCLHGLIRNFCIIAGCVVGRNQRKLGRGVGTDPGDVPRENLIRIGIDLNLNRIPDMNQTDPRFFKIGGNPDTA